MGNTLPSRLDVAELGRLKQQTDFSKEEIKDLHNQFRFLSAGKKTLSREQFEQGLTGSGVGAHDQRLLRTLFDVFDKDKSNTINFTEFCAGLSVFASRGRLSDTLDIVFAMFDLEGDHYITQDEMVSFLTACSATLELNQLSTDVTDDSKVTYDDITKWVANVFKKHDKQQRGKLDFTEFQEAVNSHPLILKLARVFVSEVCEDFFHTPSRFQHMPYPIGGSAATLDALERSSSEQTLHQAIRSTALTWIVCTNLADRCRATASTVRSFVREGDNVFVYHQKEKDETPADNLLESYVPYFDHANTKTYLDSQKRYIGINRRGRRICDYAEAKHAHIVCLGLPDPSTLDRLPWYLATHFDGLAVFIGSCAKLCSTPLDRRASVSVHWLLCIDHTECGTHATHLLASLVQPKDKVLVVTTWTPPGLESMGKAAYSSDGEWDMHLAGLRRQARDLSVQTAEQLVGNSKGVLHRGNVAAVSVENGASTDILQKIESWNVADGYEVDIMMTGLQSNATVKPLYKQIKSNPWSTTLNALFIVN